MEIIIRPPQLHDAAALNEIRRMDGVRENTLGMQSETIMDSESFIKNKPKNMHVFVAEVDGRAVGMAGLEHKAHPRLSHCGYIGVSVHTAYQGMGVGTKLMEAVLDLADNWLMLVRVELGVLYDNHGAKKLYEKLGFTQEGVKKMAVIRNGQYVDEILMARIKVPAQFEMK